MSDGTKPSTLRKRRHGTVIPANAPMLPSSSLRTPRCFPRHPCERSDASLVIPANAGNHFDLQKWIPACAGMTRGVGPDSCVRVACAGVTE